VCCPRQCDTHVHCVVTEYRTGTILDSGPDKEDFKCVMEELRLGHLVNGSVTDTAIPVQLSVAQPSA
jgi:hypothetical protein